MNVYVITEIDRDDLDRPVSLGVFAYAADALVEADSKEGFATEDGSIVSHDWAIEALVQGDLIRVPGTDLVIRRRKVW